MGLAANPAMNRLSVSPTMPGAACSARVIAGKAGNAMSMESGGNAARAPRNKMRPKPSRRNCIFAPASALNGQWRDPAERQPHRPIDRRRDLCGLRSALDGDHRPVEKIEHDHVVEQNRVVPRFDLRPNMAQTLLLSQKVSHHLAGHVRAVLVPADADGGMAQRLGDNQTLEGEMTRL